MLLELGGTRCFLILVTDSEAVTGSLSWMKKDLCVLLLILSFYFFFAFLKALKGTGMCVYNLA